MSFQPSKEAGASAWTPHVPGHLPPQDTSWALESMCRYFTSHCLCWGVLGGVLVYGGGWVPRHASSTLCRIHPCGSPSSLTLYLSLHSLMYTSVHTHKCAPIDTHGSKRHSPPNPRSSPISANPLSSSPTWRQFRFVEGWFVLIRCCLVELSIKLFDGFRGKVDI